MGNRFERRLHAARGSLASLARKTIRPKRLRRAFLALIFDIETKKRARLLLTPLRALHGGGFIATATSVGTAHRPVVHHKARAADPFARAERRRRQY